MPGLTSQTARTPESNYDRLSITEATAVQQELKKYLNLAPLSQPVKTIGGADISLDLHSETVYAGIVVLSFPEMKPLACSLIKSTTHFPYVPGYLAFREIPALLKAFEQLPEKPDIIMFDGNGIIHSRRMGIASHFGVLTGSCTMGCAKKKLWGRYEEPADYKGAYSPILDKLDTIGFALRSKMNTNPVFISPGHKMSLSDSLDMAIKCIGKYRLPEPTRKAHEFVNLFRLGQLKEGYHQFHSTTLFD